MTSLLCPYLVINTINPDQNIFDVTRRRGNVQKMEFMMSGRGYLHAALIRRRRCATPYRFLT